jgi:hypothetical protein
LSDRFGILARVSYDLAIWEGHQPADDAVAAEAFEELYRNYLEEEWQTQSTSAIAAFADALLRRWPDLTDLEGADESPFAAGPVRESASGPILYFAMSYSRADEMSAAVAEMATERGLVCFDPQQGRLLPPGGAGG